MTTNTNTHTLADVERELGELPHQYHVDQHDDAVYVNFDFDVAVVIELQEDGLFSLEMLHWDRTHGVDQEHFIGALADPDVVAAAAIAFARRRESD
jgi:hypothetical protein